MQRKFALSAIRFFFKVVIYLIIKLKVEGLEFIPKEGGYIIATNHLSVLDPPLVYLLLNRDDVTALVAKKHQKNPLFRWVVNIIGGIWLNREEADARAIRAATQHLNSGGVLGISPEGTRSPTRALIQPKTGASYLADRARAIIVPVAIMGTEEAFSRLFTFRRIPVTVRFGEPFTLPPIDRKERDEGLRRNTDEIMSRIAVLLPPEYQGVYADNPRVRELSETLNN